MQFDHVYNKVHAVTAMLGMEMSSTRYKGYSDTRYGYLPEREERASRNCRPR